MSQSVVVNGSLDVAASHIQGGNLFLLNAVNRVGFDTPSIGEGIVTLVPTTGNVNVIVNGKCSRVRNTQGEVAGSEPRVGAKIKDLKERVVRTNKHVRSLWHA